MNSTKTILALNCGSSSLKYRLISMPEEKELAGGEAQRVGTKTKEDSRVVHNAGTGVSVHTEEMKNHVQAFDAIMELLEKENMKPDVLAHRVVHGGETFSKSVLVDSDMIRLLLDIQDLAPLHNPPAMALIRACTTRFPALPQIAVFDTSFHSSIPEYAYRYALDVEFSRAMRIRKYGFHGTSHAFVSEEAAKFLGVPPNMLNAVSCHLGSGGASLCAIRRGASMDNTMGYSPLQGLMMSTRCGDIDPALVLRMLSEDESTSVENRLNRKCGVLGVSGVSSDIRDIIQNLSRDESSSERLNATAGIYMWRIRKYLGAYLLAVGRAHAVIFTDTIGESVPAVRKAVCVDMDAYGLKLDEDRNEHVEKTPVDISTEDSEVRVLVVKTNEELAMARSAFSVIMAD